MKNRSLEKLQQQMMNYLTLGDETIVNEIVNTDNVSTHTRLNIYKNAYQARLRETIDNDHPVLGMYLGDDLFEELVRQYVKSYPSSQTSLRHFAKDLPKLLNENEPFRSHPILAEIAEFERLLLSAFDAEEANILTFVMLQQLPQHEWPLMRFYFHPSLQLFHTQWNSVESWQALKEDRPPQPATQSGTHWLIWRNPFKLTEFRPLEPVEYELMNLALQGHHFSELCDYLLQNHSEADAATTAFNYLKHWLDSGLIRTL